MKGINSIITPTILEHDQSDESEDLQDSPRFESSMLSGGVMTELCSKLIALGGKLLHQGKVAQFWYVDRSRISVDEWLNVFQPHVQLKVFQEPQPSISGRSSWVLRGMVQNRIIITISIRSFSADGEATEWAAISVSEATSA